MEQQNTPSSQENLPALSRESEFPIVVEGTINKEEIYVPFISEECVSMYLDDISYICNKTLGRATLHLFLNGVHQRTFVVQPVIH